MASYRHHQQEIPTQDFYPCANPFGVHGKVSTENLCPEKQILPTIPHNIKNIIVVRQIETAATTELYLDLNCGTVLYE